MSQNPLQKYFRQPKIYIKLPSLGSYYEPNVVVQGDIGRLPVYGMTGMDEIIAKTPDALLSGESTAKVIESCIPNIVDAWKLNLLDLDAILAAIRIATYGQDLELTSYCSNCGAENHYTVDVSQRIEFYKSCKYDNKVSVDKDLVVYIKPLTYKESSDFSLKNFQLQQQLKQIIELTDEEKRQTAINETYKQVGEIQKDILFASIEVVETADVRVNEPKFIREWLENCDKSVYVLLQTKIEANREAWQIPHPKVICGECKHEQDLIVELDRSNFFEIA